VFVTEMAPDQATITPLVTGDYLAPDGPKQGSRILVVAYLVRCGDLTVLFDTGFPWDGPTVHSEPDVDIETFPRSLAEALESAGSSLDQIDVVANCHLHPDHGGGNYRVGRIPIYIQRPEFEDAHSPEHAIPSSVELDRANYVVIDGEHDLAPGIRLIPTPGHTPGHQSMLVRDDGGATVLLGQAAPGASEYALLAYHRQLEGEGDTRHPLTPRWMPRIESEYPAEVRFAHDLAVWRSPELG
jgi:N-acyl homoserine lactone hydrolase